MDINKDNTELLWKVIISKIKPYLTSDDLVFLDADRYSKLIIRLRDIKELNENELSYARKNRDLILLRMGLIHTIPDMSDHVLELALHQVAVRLAKTYYSTNVVESMEEAEKKVISLIQNIGRGSGVVSISLNPEEGIIDMRNQLIKYSKITLDNAKEIEKILSKLKDDLMEIGVVGAILHDISQVCQQLRKTREEELPMKSDILESSYEWQEKILK